MIDKMADKITDNITDKTTDKGALVKTVIVIVIITFGIYIAINFPLSAKDEEKRLFPGIIGDAILKNNETGISSIKDIILYDDFRGNITQGYKANYSSSNGTIIIFVVQMQDYFAADKSLKDMVIRSGYNDSNKNVTLGKNATVIKLNVNNPEVFVIQKNNSKIWHYTYVKLDKVYWVGFSDPDVDYQGNMLIEIYRKVDSKDEDGSDI